MGAIVIKQYPTHSAICIAEWRAAVALFQQENPRLPTGNDVYDAAAKYVSALPSSDVEDGVRPKYNQLVAFYELWTGGAK